MSRKEQFFVYMLASLHNRVLYTGVTSALVGRVYQHKEHFVDGFTKRYNVDRLVWYEIHDHAEAAIKREKQIKKWRREWKLELVEKMNPDWRDLYQEICA